MEVLKKIALTKQDMSKPVDERAALIGEGVANLLGVQIITDDVCIIDSRRANDGDVRLKVSVSSTTANGAKFMLVGLMSADGSVSGFSTNPGGSNNELSASTVESLFIGAGRWAGVTFDMPADHTIRQHPLIPIPETVS